MDSFTPLGSQSGSLVSDHEPIPEPEVEYDDRSPEDAQSRLDYIKSIVPPSKPARKWPVIVLIVIVGLGLIAGAGFFYTKHHKTEKSVVRVTVVSKTPTPRAQASVGGISHYVSNGTDLNLAFDYPSHWSVTPLSGNNPNDQTIILNSPLQSIENSAGQNVTGKVTVSIRPGSTSMTELASGVATAGQASVQFAYTKPTGAQFQYPYLTFIDLAAGANPASIFQEVVISGTTQFAKSQAITASSIAVDPIITASFYSCATTVCAGSNAVPLSITNDTWQNNIVFQQTLALFESLQLN